MQRIKTIFCLLVALVIAVIPNHIYANEATTTSFNETHPAFIKFIDLLREEIVSPKTQLNIYSSNTETEESVYCEEFTKLLDNGTYEEIFNYIEDNDLKVSFITKEVVRTRSLNVTEYQSGYAWWPCSDERYNSYMGAMIELRGSFTYNINTGIVYSATTPNLSFRYVEYGPNTDYGSIDNPSTGKSVFTDHAYFCGAYELSAAVVYSDSEWPWIIDYVYYGEFFQNFNAYPSQ